MLSALSLAILGLALPSLEVQKKFDKMYVAKQNSGKVIGSIGWEITEPSSGKVLGHGNRQIRLREVAIAVVGKLSGQELMTKRVLLSNHFVLELAGSTALSRDQVLGFALNADRDDRQAFAWDWFTVDRPTHATKLQETGEVAIKISKVGQLWDITRTKFLTEVSLRVSRFDASTDPLDPTWRVKISKGSWLDWPSLVGGRVVAN